MRQRRLRWRADGARPVEDGGMFVVGHMAALRRKDASPNAGHHDELQAR